MITLEFFFNFYQEDWVQDKRISQDLSFELDLFWHKNIHYKVFINNPKIV